MARHKDLERESVQRDTRQRLLAAATAAFAREGYAGANINYISKAAGFAHGTIYNYFASKRALMLALIEEIAAQHLAFVEEQVRQADDPARRLELFFTAGFRWVTANLAQGRVMVNNLYGPDAEFKHVMYEAYQPMFQLVAHDIVAAGMQQGVFRAVDPVVTAGLLMNMYLGVASQVNDEGQTWLSAGQVADFARHALQK